MRLSSRRTAEQRLGLMLKRQGIKLNGITSAQGRAMSGCYRESGGYCLPMNDKAPAAMPKTGQCPSGWMQSGDSWPLGQPLDQAYAIDNMVLISRRRVKLTFR